VCGSGVGRGGWVYVFVWCFSAMCTTSNQGNVDAVGTDRRCLLFCGEEGGRLCVVRRGVVVGCVFLGGGHWR
jgi:hypothetical protein